MGQVLSSLKSIFTVWAIVFAIATAVLRIWYSNNCSNRLLSSSSVQVPFTQPPMRLDTHFGYLNIQNGPLYNPSSGLNSHNTRGYLPGMDVDFASNSRRNGYTTIAYLTPQEQHERSRLRDARDQASAHYDDAPTMDRGVRFGVPSMGYRTGAHRTMGDRSTVLGTWDHRATRPWSPSHRNSMGLGSGSSFSNLRIGEQHSPTPHTGTRDPQSSNLPGMQVDRDRVDYQMGRPQLGAPYLPQSVRHNSQANLPGMVDSVQGMNSGFANLRVNDQDSSATNTAHRHSQAYPPGMDDPVESANHALANLRVNNQQASTADTTDTVSSGNPYLPGMGYRHAFALRGRENM